MSADAPAGEGRPLVDSPLRRLLVLMGLTGFAVSQPALSIAGANPTIFVFNNVGRVAMVVGAIAVALAVPLVLWLCVQGVGRIDVRAGHGAFLAVCAVLGLLAGIQLGRELGIGGVSWALGLAVAIGGVWALRAVPAVAEWLGYTAVLPLLALALFLFTSDSSDLLSSREGVAAGNVAGTEPSVVVVLFDELPTLTLLDDQGLIDEQVFPNFHRLSNDATWYPNFTTMSATTETAVPALLSGTNPRTAQPLWTSYPDTLFSLLAPTHGLTVDESFTRLCGLTSCTTAGPGQASDSSSRLTEAADQIFDLWVDRIRGKEGVDANLADFEELPESSARTLDDDRPGGFGEALFPDDATVRRNPERLSRFVESIAPSERPHLWFLHLVLPHIPFRWYADGTQYASEPDPLTTGALGRQVEWLAALDEQRHILQAQYADRLLGQILDALEGDGIYDDTAVVVVVDHGMSFVVGEGRRSMDAGGRNSTAYVPLLVKAPGQTDGVIDDANLMTPDLLPLIADVVGVEIAFEVDGAAPGDAVIAARGAQKTYRPSIGELGSKELGDPVSWDAGAQPLDVADRRLDPTPAAQSELGPLLELLDGADLIGTSISDHSPSGSTTAKIFDLDTVVTPVADRAAVMAFVQGSLPSGPATGEVLVEADGTIVSGSKIFEGADGPSFIAMLPSSVAGSGFELGLVVRDPEGGLIGVEIEGD